MIIEKYVYKGKGHYKGYEHPFEYIDDNRKVDINTTGEIICKIKKSLDFSPNTKNEKLKAYKSKWNRYLTFHLIADGINPHIDAGQYYVKQNYQLLEDNKSLTYNQALFLLLGLNAHELGRAIKDFPVLDGDEPIAKLFELYFWRTKQNQALRQSSFVVDRKITSENLKTLADKNRFFTKHNDYLLNRTKDEMDEKIAKKLYELLKEAGYITGKYNELWQWGKDTNELAFLASYLSTKGILKTKHYKKIIDYIQDPSSAKKPLNSYEMPKDQNKIIAIENIVKQSIL